MSTATLPPYEPTTLPPSFSGGDDRATPGTGLGQAIRRHRLLVLLPILLLVGAGVAAGLLRDPIYKAESRLLVGKVNPNAPALGGLVQASTALADAYSRSIESTKVIFPVARSVNLSPLTVSKRLTASPVPESPVIRVIAESPTAAAATRLSNVASRRLARFVGHLNQSSTAGPRLLTRYRRATAALSQASQLVNAATAAYADDPTPRNGQLLDAATATRGAAELRAQSFGNAYALDQAATTSSAGLISILSLASTADSDRTKVLELLVFMGLIVGAAIGIALAWIREDRLRRRRVAAAA
ncbi:MAG TPA: hypothetical protein VFG31_09895 [Conexibacter sp.]|nr:hypothetical protein [Conexibacter sp.]